MSLALSFEKALNIGINVSREFVFDPIYTIRGIKYFISVFDINDIQHVIDMINKNGSSIIITPAIAPQRIKNL